MLISVAVTACWLDLGGTNSSPQQTDRERKAAGVTEFKIRCAKDLWERTSGNAGNAGDRRKVETRSVKDEPGEIVTVTLSGPQMVDYLRRLDYYGHGGAGNDLSQSACTTRSRPSSTRSAPQRRPARRHR